MGRPCNAVGACHHAVAAATCHGYKFAASVRHCIPANGGGRCTCCPRNAIATRHHIIHASSSSKTRGGSDKRIVSIRNAAPVAVVNRLCVRPGHSVSTGHHSVVKSSTRDGNKLVVSPGHRFPLLNSCRNSSIRPSNPVGTRHYTVGTHSHRDKCVVSVGDGIPTVGARAARSPCDAVGTCHDAVSTESCHRNEDTVPVCHGSPAACGHIACCPSDAVGTCHYTVRTTIADCDKGAISKSHTAPLVRFCCAARGPGGSVRPNLLGHDRN